MRSLSTWVTLSAVFCVVAVGCGDDANDLDQDKPDASDDAGDGTSGKGDGHGSGGRGSTGNPNKNDAGEMMTASDAGAKDAGDPGSDHETCDDLTCMKPATCDRDAKTPRCVCPDGYEAKTSGGKTTCKDVDECADGDLNDCDAHATCTNKAGGYACKCEGPAYAGNGKSCDCADGYTDVDGECLIAQGGGCEDGDACESGHCVAGVCCASACDDPPVCQVAEGATCEDGETCVYPAAESTVTCDDDDACTDGDHCDDGACQPGTSISCDDGNTCTADSCDPAEGCEHDGTGVTTAGCLPDDACGQGYHCFGDKDGSCTPATVTSCANLDDACHAGMCDPIDGCEAVAVENGTACDADACTLGGMCMNGACVGGTQKSCDDQNPCTNDGCDPVGGCSNTNNTDPCSDGNLCTENDHCGNGACQPGAAKNCSGQDDDCNLGVCVNMATGACGKAPRQGSPACDDGNSCSASSTCSSGNCVPSGQFDACGAHATACAAGSPNTCTCQDDYTSVNGTCVPTASTNECTNSPCDPNATCNDPSADSGDVQCTCKLGFTGNGMTGAALVCTDIDECASDPCGDYGDCVEDAPGSYSCDCDDGYTAVGNKCVCDMNGTFALRIKTTVELTDVDGTEDIDPPTVIYSWTKREQTYDAQGNLVVTETPCGDVKPELCGAPTAFAFLGPQYDFTSQAFAQYIPNSVWGTAGEHTIPSMSLTNPIPGAALVTSPAAELIGIHLTDPLGNWPSARNRIADSAGVNAPNGSAPTNGAYWVNEDNDTKLGVTSFAVPPGGVTESMGTPPIDYGTVSKICPRADEAANWAYTYWPAQNGINVARVSRFYVASRVVRHLRGTIESCDRATGTVRGRTSTDQLQTDARFYGCMQSNGNDCGSIVDFYDGTAQTQEITGSTFVMERITSGPTTCDAIRAKLPPD
jgi:hypothetical protein